MADKGFKRKLTSIFSADAVGYSRLMGKDEEATVRTLTSYRSVISTLIKQYNGTVIDSPGDNLMAEFVSVVDAVQCAVAVQKELKARNDELPENRRMPFRIGINLGDVIQEEDRIYGDGVNIAARLEGLAEPGGICISKTAFDHIETKLPYGYEFLGDQTVKNIAKPVGAYRVLLEPRVTVAELPKAEKPATARRRRVMIVVTVALVIAITLVVWQLYIRRPSVAPASIDKMAFPLPDKPSIAVLPFKNLSDDPTQEYFCDGMSEDLITDLSKISGIFVIARNSTFAYKGESVKINQVAEELGVRYVLEGSVRKADKQIRINAQLIDAVTGHHLWANRYDGNLENVFALQDKITQKIIGALAIKLTANEKNDLAFRGTDNINAYDAFLQGWDYYLRSTPDAFKKAIPFFEKALALDPNYGAAYAALALTYWSGSYAYYETGILGLSSIIEGRLLARHYLEQALKMPSSLSHRIASSMALNRRQFKEAIEEAERAIALEPNDASCQYTMAEALVYGANPHRGIEYIETAMRLDPRFQTNPLYLFGIAYFCMEQYEKAVSFLERAFKRIPEPGQRLYPLVAAYAHLGRYKEAKKAAELWQQQLGLKYTMYHFPFKDPEVAERFVDGLIKAGYPARHSDYYKIYEENRLSGEEIKNIAFGQKVAASDGVVDRTKDGKATYRGYLGKSDKGKSWLEGDLLCDQWQKRYEGYKNCYPVFRNPEGSRKKLDEYLAATDFGIITWSSAE